MRLVATLLIALATAAPAPPPSPSPRPAAEAPAKANDPAAAPRRSAQLANVRLDIKITERRASGEPLTKLVSMTVADMEQGKIRSVAEPPPGGNFPSVPLHVDARPVIEGNRVRLRISLDYTADRPVDASPKASTLNVKEDLSVIMENGRPMTVADAVDPMGDRRVQVEVTATILR